LPEATQWSGVARPVQSPTAIEHHVAFDDPETGRLMGQPREAFELRERDPSKV
jgi:hypothetical protein